MICLCDRVLDGALALHKAVRAVFTRTRGQRRGMMADIPTAE
jgi:hypothetical protein